MSIKNLGAYIVAGLIFLSSCEKVIKVNVPTLNKKLVLNCIADVGGPFSLSLSRSAKLTERNTVTDVSISNAVIKLYTNGVYIETIVYDSLNGYWSNTTAQEGKLYTLKVTAPGYDDIEASVTAPGMVPISGISRNANARKTPEGNDQDEVNINFSDPAGGTDYYIIKIQAWHDSTGMANMMFCVNSPDAGIETINNDIATSTTCLDNEAIFLRDQLFDGRQKELILYGESYSMAPKFNGSDSLFASLELWHVSEGYFRFLKSSRVARDVNGDPFAEPVNVYTNVTNGLGIFAIVSRDGKQIK